MLPSTPVVPPRLLTIPNGKQPYLMLNQSSPQPLPSIQKVPPILLKHSQCCPPPPPPRGPSYTHRHTQ